MYPTEAFLEPLFTRVRRRGILGSSPVVLGSSPDEQGVKLLLQGSRLLSATDGTPCGLGASAPYSEGPCCCCGVGCPGTGCPGSEVASGSTGTTSPSFGSTGATSGSTESCCRWAGGWKPRSSCCSTESCCQRGLLCCWSEPMIPPSRSRPLLWLTRPPPIVEPAPVPSPPPPRRWIPGVAPSGQLPHKPQERLFPIPRSMAYMAPILITKATAAAMRPLTTIERRAGRGRCENQPTAALARPMKLSRRSGRPGSVSVG